MITLTKTGASALYQPLMASATDRLAFLAAKAGTSIALADCWADHGSPRVAGYFVLMDRQADSSEASTVETLLFNDPVGPKLPMQPKANGLVWLLLGGGTQPRVIAVSSSDLDPSGNPIVLSDSIVANNPGERLLGFGKGATIAGEADQGGDWLSVTVFSPPIAASGLQPPSAPGQGPAIRVDLSPSKAELITFRGLVDNFASRQGGLAVKELVEVRVDPVDPLNSEETYTGRRYVLIEDGTGIHLRASG